MACAQGMTGVSSLSPFHSYPWTSYESSPAGQQESPGSHSGSMSQDQIGEEKGHTGVRCWTQAGRDTCLAATLSRSDVMSAASNWFSRAGKARPWG